MVEGAVIGVFSYAEPMKAHNRQFQGNRNFQGRVKIVLVSMQEGKRFHNFYFRSTMKTQRTIHNYGITTRMYQTLKMITQTDVRPASHI